ncbi:MAG: phage integrase N-terminal SAM-like domain-containing protein, partial [Methylococcales bacterium]
MLIPPPSARPEPTLSDRLRDKFRVKHYSIRTEQAYVDWCRRFILFQGKLDPADLGKPEVEAFCLVPTLPRGNAYR